jgi:hypothetical protein
MAYNAPILMATKTPSLSFRFRDRVLIIHHGRIARRISIAPDQAAIKERLAMNKHFMHDLDWRLVV